MEFKLSHCYNDRSVPSAPSVIGLAVSGCHRSAPTTLLDGVGTNRSVVVLEAHDSAHLELLRCFIPVGGLWKPVVEHGGLVGCVI